MSWFSPVFPVGAYSYSSGIEWAVESGDVTNAQTLLRWLRVILTMGGSYCDAILIAQSHRAVVDNDDRLLRAIIELATAIAPTKERFLETTAQGRAFLATVTAAWPCAALERLGNGETDPIALPIAAGVASAGHDIPATPAIHAYLHGQMANLISAGVRLIPIGQTDGQRLLAALENDIAATVERARAATLDDLSTSAFRADLASMHHETQYTRLFRS